MHALKGPSSHLGTVLQRGWAKRRDPLRWPETARRHCAEPPPRSDVLVLDDSLSAVDTETDRRIREALSERRGNRTTVIITHRVSTLATAERILVLEGGRIAALGSHAELVAREGLYRRLWLIQGDLEAELESELAGKLGDDARAMGLAAS